MLLAVSLLIFVAGLGLQIAQFIMGGWPTLLPLYLMIFAAPFIGWAIWARRHRRGPRAPFLARRASAIGVPLCIGLLLVRYVATGRKTIVVEAMTWTVLTEGNAEPVVQMRFGSAPDHFLRVVPDDQVAFLASQPDTVQAIFEITRDFGRVRSSRLVEIRSFSGRVRTISGGCDGGCRESPW